MSNRLDKRQEFLSGWSPQPRRTVRIAIHLSLVFQVVYPDRHIGKVQPLDISAKFLVGESRAAKLCVGAGVVDSIADYGQPNSSNMLPMTLGNFCEFTFGKATTKHRGKIEDTIKIEIAKKQIANEVLGRLSVPSHLIWPIEQGVVGVLAL